MTDQEETKAKVSPVLRQQLEAAAASGETVQAVFFLRSRDPAKKFAQPSETPLMVEEVLERVGKDTGEAPRKQNVFQNLGSFVVEASVEFLEGIIEQPEIATATANVRPGSSFIPPVERGPDQ